MRNVDLIRGSIDALRRIGFFVEYALDYSWVCVHGVDLPGPRGSWTDARGSVVSVMSVLIPLPWDFPVTPPGVGFRHPKNAIHIPTLYFRGGMMEDVYECSHTPPWRWFCFQSLDWDPKTDNLLSLVGLVETSVSERLRRAKLC